METKKIGSKQYTLRKRLIALGITNGKGDVKYSDIAKDTGHSSSVISNAFRNGLTVGMYNKICDKYGIKI